MAYQHCSISNTTYCNGHSEDINEFPDKCFKTHQEEPVPSQSVSVVVSDQMKENSNSYKGTFTELIMPNSTDQIIGLRLSQDNVNNRNSMGFSGKGKDSQWVGASPAIPRQPSTDENMPSHEIFLSARGNTR